MLSIIVITYNRQALLLKTVKSILNQTFSDFELLLIDDGSDDDTEEMIQSLGDERIKYYNFGRIGNLSKLRNLGIKKSEKELIAFCDDDDLWHPFKLERQIKYMDRFDFVCSNADVIDINDNIISKSYFDDIKTDIEINFDFLLSKGNIILTSSCLVKRKIFYDPETFFDEIKHTNYCEDYELFIRLSRKSRILFVNENLILKRSHASVSGGISNSIKMLNTSISIISDYRNLKDPVRDRLPIEGILGFRILLTKYAFKKSIKDGFSEFFNSILFIIHPNNFYVFINTKVKSKIQKTLKNVFK